MSLGCPSDVPSLPLNVPSLPLRVPSLPLNVPSQPLNVPSLPLCLPRLSRGCPCAVPILPLNVLKLVDGSYCIRVVMVGTGYAKKQVECIANVFHTSKTARALTKHELCHKSTRKQPRAMRGPMLIARTGWL